MSAVERPVGPDGKTPVALPREVFTDDEIESYLGAVERGVGLDRAARGLVDERGVPRTSTFVKRVLRRDEGLWERFEEALATGRIAYREKLRGLAEDRAETSDRILEVELATHVPEYDHLRRDRVKVDARVEHAIVFDPSGLDRLTTEELVALRDLLGKLDGEIVDADARELGPGE